MWTLYATVPYRNAFNKKFMKEFVTSLDQHLGIFFRNGGGGGFLAIGNLKGVGTVACTVHLYA
jgi:hypothetical protein